MCAYISRLVVFVAVAKHQIEVIDALLGIHVVERLNALLYCAHVHRICYNFIVVLARTHHGLVTHHVTAQKINAFY